MADKQPMQHDAYVREPSGQRAAGSCRKSRVTETRFAVSLCTRWRQGQAPTDTSLETQLLQLGEKYAVHVHVIRDLQSPRSFAPYLCPLGLQLQTI
jgi:hypothetical protein